MFDLVIRGGLVVDGSGLTAFPADVAVQGDRIAKIGRITEPAIREIDARDHIVTPGFIDGHTHYDAQFHWDPLSAPSCWQGVTTTVVGNCGFSLAPVRKGEHALVIRNLERAEDISPAALELGINWRWETFPELLDVMEAMPKGINYGCNIGHSALRTWAMGERAFGETANEDELRLMEAQVEAAITAGAVGFSSSRSPSHETSDDRPVPSRFANWEEYARLCGVTGRMGGLIELAIDQASRSPDPDVRGEALDKLKRLAVETGAPVTFGVMPDATGEIFRAHLKMFDDAAQEGGIMFGQAHSRGLTVLLSFATTLPFDKLAEWKPIRRLPKQKQLQALRDPDVRARLIHAAHHGDYGPQAASAAEAGKPDWSVVRLYETPLPPHPLVADRARTLGLDPVELMIDLAIETDLEQMFISSYGAINEDHLEEIMRHPRTVMTFSDAGAHVGQIVDACVQTHLLAYWARDKRRFSLEEAVRMVTYSPARAWGFHDRGLLRPGMIADINVIDYHRLDPGMPKVVHDLPGGGHRLDIRAKGYHAGIVSGQVVIQDGEHSGALPGRLIRRA